MCLSLCVALFIFHSYIQIELIDLYFIASSGAIDEDDLKTYEKIIQSSIKQNAERGGFVPYRYVSKAIVGSERVLEKALEAGGSYSRTDSYFAKKAAVLIYQLIQRFDSKEQAAQFIEANRGLEDIRQLVITGAISQKNYEEALKLALEGEQQDADRGLPGLVVQWKKKQLEIYKLMNAIEPQRQLTEEWPAVYRAISE